MTFWIFWPSTPPLSNFDTSIHVRTSCHWLYIIHSVPPICRQLQTQFCNSQNFQKKNSNVTPVLKTLWNNLSDGTLKLSNVKLDAFLNWLSKQFLKQQIFFLHNVPSSTPRQYLKKIASRPLHPNPLAISLYTKVTQCWNWIKMWC